MRKRAAEKFSRRILDNDLKNLVGDYGAKGLAYFKVVGGKLESSIAKFFTDDQQKAVVERMPDVLDADMDPGAHSPCSPGRVVSIGIRNGGPTRPRTWDQPVMSR